MRSDMGKVVITRPRTHSRSGYREIRHARTQDVTKLKNIVNSLRYHANDDLEDDFEDLAANGLEPMRKAYLNLISNKEFTDMLNPIERYLHSRIGDRWDDVWSEVCQNLRGGVAIEHVRDHVLQMVNFKGGTFSFGNYHHTENDEYMYGIMFYVDDDGLIGLIRFIFVNSRIDLLRLKY